MRGVRDHLPSFLWWMSSLARVQIRQSTTFVGEDFTVRESIEREKNEEREFLQDQILSTPNTEHTEMLWPSTPESGNKSYMDNLCVCVPRRDRRHPSGLGKSYSGPVPCDSRTLNVKWSWLGSCPHSRFVERDWYYELDESLRPEWTTGPWELGYQGECHDPQYISFLRGPDPSGQHVVSGV